MKNERWTIDFIASIDSGYNKCFVELTNMFSEVGQFELRHRKQLQLGGEDQADLFIFAEDFPNLRDAARRVGEQKGFRILLADEKSPHFNLYFDELFEQVWITPLRKMEVISNLHGYLKDQTLEQVSSFNVSLRGFLEDMRSQAEWVEGIFERIRPRRFEPVRGFEFESRYLVGSRPGGDYFDILESDNGEYLGLVLSDSSSYQLSGALLSVLMRVVARVGLPHSQSASAMIKRVHQEILMVTKETDQLSLFIGIIHRHTLKMNYVLLGNIHAYVNDQTVAGDPRMLSRSSGVGWIEDRHLDLQPGDLLSLFSDGICENQTAWQKLVGNDLFRRLREDSAAAVNDILFEIKKNLPKDQELPEQDCSIMAIQVDSKYIRRVS